MLYLDHAATSFPKPAAVTAAVLRWYRDLGVAPGRGDSHRTGEVTRLVDQTRAALGRLLGMPPARVAFTSGATEGLNLFLRGFLRRGDRVLTTAFEHSSVVRPLGTLQRERDLTLRVLPPDRDGGLAPATVDAALTTFAPRLFVFTHASNVTGVVFDAAAFCQAARAAGSATLLDVSQTAGWFDLRVGADAIAGSAHKALLGPPGLGFLAVRDGLPVVGQKQGGTGSSRALAEHPADWPTAFEAGTPNTPAILGLLAALEELDAAAMPARRAAALAAVDALAAALSADPRVRLLPPPTGPRTPVLSFVRQDLDPAEIGAILDQADIHVRTGHHCAPWLHEHLGTDASGTVRVSPGADVTATDILAVSAALAG